MFDLMGHVHHKKQEEKHYRESRLHSDDKSLSDGICWIGVETIFLKNNFDTIVEQDSG